MGGDFDEAPDWKERAWNLQQKLYPCKSSIVTADWKHRGDYAVPDGVEAISRHSGEVTHVLEVSSTTERGLRVDCQWFGQYQSNELKAF